MGWFTKLFGNRVAKQAKLGSLDVLKEMGLPGIEFDSGDAEAMAPDARVWFCDGEEMCEGAIGKWLEELRPYLEGQGATFGKPIDNLVVNGKYDITIDGVTHFIYDVPNDLSWLIASGRALEIVDSLLESAGSAERCYLLYPGGNEGIAIFITPDIRERITSDPRVDYFEQPISAAECMKAAANSSNDSPGKISKSTGVTVR